MAEKQEFVKVADLDSSQDEIEVADELEAGTLPTYQYDPKTGEMVLLTDPYA